MSHISVIPLAPAAAWLGGKSKLATTIVPILEAIPHECYAEPFTGMGGIFFRRSKAAKSEVINDYSRDVANFFRIIRHHHQALLLEMEWLFDSREEFDRIKSIAPEMLTDIQRAARFYYLQRLSFGGKCVHQSYGVNTGGPARFDQSKAISHIRSLAQRLRRVHIENLSYDRFIEIWDRPSTLFYLDPPYWGCEGDYGKHLFTRDDFVKLAEQLAGVSGTFVLSINDVPEIREIFQKFNILPVTTTYTAGGGHQQMKAAELLISNRPQIAGVNSKVASGLML